MTLQDYRGDSLICVKILKMLNIPIGRQNSPWITKLTYACITSQLLQLIYFSDVNYYIF